MINEKIPEGKVALVEVDPWTGVPLDKNHQWTDERSAFIILAENIDDATKIGLQKVEENPLSEWWILDHLGNTCGCLKNENAISNEAEKRKKMQQKSSWFTRWFHK